MSYMDTYKDWLSWCDDEAKAELLAIEDAKELEDRFYCELKFGTGGMRGVMGMGPNRMNKYMIRKATKGFADYLFAHCTEKERARGVVIAYDSRHHSQEFAREAAKVLTSAGIPVKIFAELEPTPVLSFAVRHLGAIAGLVLTASHNPKEYNGYKVYDRHGDQIVPRIANRLIQCVKAVTDIPGIEAAGNPSLVQELGEGVVDAFVEAVYRESVCKGDVGPLRIVYTPLHGAGMKPVRKVLARAGFADVHVVHEQEMPDGDFSTVKSPNPEEKSALTLGLQLASEIGADIVIGTDPDSDRIGVGVRQGNEYILLTGNQLGALLADFLLEAHKAELTSATTVMKTVVTGELGAAIARARGCQVVETLTGFKYIGDKISDYRTDPAHDFFFGYEESYGCLVGTYAQDKDAVGAALLVAEMAACCKKQGKTLCDRLHELYAEYGYYYDAQASYKLQGIAGKEKIASIMDTLRKQQADSDFIHEPTEVLDFAKGIADLPTTNLLKYKLVDGSWIAIRPSGTEPKLKLYCSLVEKDESAAKAKFAAIRANFEQIFDL
ncbi:phospho-sugar mutase [Mitsuokella multacida]|uniref:Phosphoglucomutase n=1 Tax=Mitsuokella multacida TaxID=52226 RepID=A0A414NYV3_9FIRM|nr:phospho-sugar mutase [Mitsuokella multacida]RHF52871.1 phospho-sugar mutase [Mitsuokella multacida]